MSTTQQTTEQQAEPEPLYEAAHPMSVDKVFRTWLPERFLRELVDEEVDGRNYGWRRFRVAGLYRDPFQALFVYPDQTRVFVGEDETARDSNGLFGFVIDENSRLPAVRTIDEALDLLKPSQARAAEVGGAQTLRQGEWFLVPADNEPASKTFSGEVSERPFGGSPLENHVPTEWALGITEDEFMQRFRNLCPDLDGHVETPAEAFHRVWQGFQIAEVDGVELKTDLPTVDELREVAEPIYVRGTLRHRENDHYMERIGDDWHLAVTHEVDVLTADTDELTDSRSTRRLRYD